MKKRNRMLALLLSMAVTAGNTGAAFAAADPDAAKASKDETVYVLLKAGGTVEQTIVSEWLKNPEGLNELLDVSTLSDIENVKGEETFTEGEDGSITWAANGTDIYYQGTGKEPAPVTWDVEYYLNGEKISWEELAGQSGSVTIRFTFTNHTFRTEKIRDREEEICVPFTAMTGVLLDSDRFSNVEVTNGKVISDGDHLVILGMTFPGLQQSLDLDPEIAELPSSMEITADVDEFAMGLAATAVSKDMFCGWDTEPIDAFCSIDPEGTPEEILDGLINEEGESSDQLQSFAEQVKDGIEGIGQLLEGSKALKEGCDQLDEGVGTLLEGAESLTDGLETLTENNEALTGGAKQVFDTLLARADTELAAAGLEVEALTVENYEEVLDGILESLDETAVHDQALELVKAAVSEQRDQIRLKVTEAVMQEVEKKVLEEIREQVTLQVSEAVNAQVTEEDKAQAMIEAQVEEQMNSDAVAAMKNQAVEEQMTSEEVLAVIEEHTDEQIDQIAEEQMASNEEVQAKIEEAAQGYQAIEGLKASLDSYHTFYTGLQTYTDGVSAAADGAATLKAGVESLKEGSASLAEGAQALFDGATEVKERIKEAMESDEFDVQATLERAGAMLKAADAYGTFAGIADNMEGTTTFIYRMEGIEAK